MKRYDRVVYDCPAGPWIGTVMQVSKNYYNMKNWREDGVDRPGVMVLFDGFSKARWMSLGRHLIHAGNQTTLA